MEEEKIQQFASDFFRVEEEIGSVIIGQKELVRNVLTWNTMERPYIP